VNKLHTISSVRKALDFMLQQQEPYPAIVIDRYWNLLLTNNAATRLLTAFIEPDQLQARFYLRIECLFPADEITEHNWKQT
jgi:hypothetical protein